MANVKSTFKPSKIIRRFMMTEFFRIPPRTLIDIVTDIKTDSAHDLKILKKWEDHFKRLKKPHVITREGDKLKLWKRKEAPDRAKASQW